MGFCLGPEIFINNPPGAFSLQFRRRTTPMFRWGSPNRGSPTETERISKRDPEWVIQNGSTILSFYPLGPISREISSRSSIRKAIPSQNREKAQGKTGEEKIQNMGFVFSVRIAGKTNPRIKSGPCFSVPGDPAPCGSRPITDSHPKERQ